MSLDAVRETIDATLDDDAAVFARRTRNALAQAILAEAMTHRDERPPERAAPRERLRERAGADLGDALAEIYAGTGDWTSRAIDALEPLNAMAHR
jgi:putative heme iron utilization protein